MPNATPPLFQNSSQLPPIVQYIVERRWLYHAMFWLLYIVVSLFSDWSFLVAASINLFSLFAILAVIMIGAYLQASYLMPKFLYEKKYDKFIIGTILIYIFEIILAYWISISIYHRSEYIRSLMKLEEINYFGGTSIFVFYLFFVPSVKIIKDLIVLQQQRQALENENMKSDLQFLKGQLSPHLLFNTLNNLYGLALLKSDNLPPLMLRLSDVMRYSLYETNQTYVNLNQEITYLKNYLELEKLRVGNEVKLDISFPENIDLKVQIAPMLLIVFIENAFKHSRHAAKNNRYIDMALTLDETVIYFSIKNSFAEKNAYFQSNTEMHSGIGLELTKRRLNILYENKHTLTVDNEDNVFDIKLELKY